MNESEIRTLYQTLPDEKISVYGAYTTRMEGFLDILLSRFLLCSEEVYWLLGRVHTHRGEYEPVPGLNSSISFSPGHVSYKYSNRDFDSRVDFQGGVGVFVPLPALLTHEPLQFMHTNSIGNLGMYDVSTKNIIPAVHRARREGRLQSEKDSGYGYIFETMLYASGEYRKWTKFPRIDLEDKSNVIAAPASMKEQIYQELDQRRMYHQQCLEILNGNNHVVSPPFYKSDIVNKEKTTAFLQRMVEPFDEKRINLWWYPHRNLEIALWDLCIINH